MALYTMGDLHLSLQSNKSMEVFGSGWQDYVRRLQEGFAQLNDDDVIVLRKMIALKNDADMTLEEATKSVVAVLEVVARG